MRIEFERTGGFAGLRAATTVDTDTLPAAEADALRALVSAAGVFELPATLRASAPVRDQFAYKLTVTDGARTHTVRMDESAVPASARPLIDWLVAALQRSQRARR
jgi:hypothetical protein